jgi:LacI family transcriptional regulator
METTPTIYAVATAAGVAPSTVSRVFSRPGRVAYETAAHVRAVAEEIGYRSRPRSVDAGPHRSTGVVAVLVSDLRNAFYRPVIRGIEDIAAPAGVTVLVLDGAAPGAPDRNTLDRVVGAVDGIIVADPSQPDGLVRAVARRSPLVLLNRTVPDLSCVVRDNSAGIRGAAELLARLGHRSVTFVRGPEDSWSSGVRWQALRQAGHELGLKVRRTGPHGATVRGGYLAVSELRRHRPSAVVAFNDLVALGVLRGLAAAGLTVPRDASVVGFDDAPFARTARPPLTTVGSSNRALGAAAMGRVLAVAGAECPDADWVVLPTRLVVRGSTAQRGRRSSRSG